MNEIEIIKIICLFIMGVLFTLVFTFVVAAIAWAKGYKDGAKEAREFYCHLNLKKDDEKSEKNESD